MQRLPCIEKAETEEVVVHMHPDLSSVGKVEGAIWLLRLEKADESLHFGAVIDMIDVLLDLSMSGVGTADVPRGNNQIDFQML